VAAGSIETEENIAVMGDIMGNTETAQNIAAILNLE
jgi:hypothetical protein